MEWQSYRFDQIPANIHLKRSREDLAERFSSLARLSSVSNSPTRQKRDIV